jgi:hypothetical protein
MQHTQGKKKIVLIIVLLLSTIGVFAEIGVKSFRKLEADMDARINYKVNDPGGVPCAIIKVVTTQTGFSFDCGMIGIMKTEQHNGEMWVYIPYSTKRLSISHPQLGILRDYLFPEPIEKATVYELVLISGRVETTVVEEISTQWLLINPQPADAMVYFDEQFVKNGIYQAKVKPGKHTYRVEAPLYHTEAGSVEITDAKKELNVTLLPAFGYLSVNSSPEQGAKIIVDGKSLSQLTPAETEALASGEHTVQVIKEMFSPAMQKVTITDGQTTEITANLSPSFAELNIAAPANASLFINNTSKGTGSWQGRLAAGVYSLEARLEKHRPATQDVELGVGDIKNITLQPTPIYGTLDVITEPPGFMITIDGKEFGTTPNTISELLVGDYTVQLSKQGYASANRTVTITEGQSVELNEKLSNSRAVSIRSIPAGAELYIDNQRVGVTPYSGNLTYGNHSLFIEKGGKRAEKIVNIVQGGDVAGFSLSLGLQGFTNTVGGVSFEMVFVPGGTFLMGSTDGENDEKPVHRVTLSDFYIGGIEVTQAQWEAVMGSNPSYFKGDDLPVEQVSWEDCQEFIGKLNKMTGKTYRLPTEAEWEYAARGGTQSKGYIYSGSSDIVEVAEYEGDNNKKTKSVGGRKANELGIYDMSGNVWEWCSDLYGSYSSREQTNPKGVSSGSDRVLRGGSWYDGAKGCQVSFRFRRSSVSRNNILGFRLVLAP